VTDTTSTGRTLPEFDTRGRLGDRHTALADDTGDRQRAGACADHVPVAEGAKRHVEPGTRQAGAAPRRHRVGVAAHLSGVVLSVAPLVTRFAMGKASSIPRIAVVAIDRTKVDLEITDPEHFDTGGDRRSYPANRGGGMRRVGSCCLPENNTSAIDRILRPNRGAESTVINAPGYGKLHREFLEGRRSWMLCLACP
jgi:hypothetical protein